jgi:hypothetical protein
LGCFLSPLLFTIVIEPLVTMISTDTEIGGVLGGGKKTQAAYVCRRYSTAGLLFCIESYSSLSSYKMNWDKSKAMSINAICYSGNVTPFSVRG